jgi:hypothetical protein
VMGRCVVLEAAVTPKLQAGDRLRIERVLEAIPDACAGSTALWIGYLSANIGVAEVLYVGTFSVIARYSGVQPIQTGDLATLIGS